MNRTTQFLGTLSALTIIGLLAACGSGANTTPGGAAGGGSNTTGGGATLGGITTPGPQVGGTPQSGSQSGSTLGSSTPVGAVATPTR